MAYTSQFTIYSSNDIGHPVLTGGTSGSLLAVLNACLITGYGSKPGAGWTKTGSIGPAAGLAIPDSGSCGIFVQPTGSQATMFMSDCGSGGGLQNARMSGYDYITQFTASSFNITGSNPFPTVAQNPLNTGVNAVGIRKSATINSIERAWIIFADSSSMYGFINSGDSPGVYIGFAFGDIYSIKSGSVDTSKCVIIGRSSEGNSYAGGNDTLDALTLVNAATSTHYMQRSFSGAAVSITCGKHGDANKGSSAYLLGITQFPNSVDNSLWVSPVWVHENTTSTIRGRMRGFYHILHPTTNFVDGQIFVCNTGTFAGKTFQIVKAGNANNQGTVFCMEISNTVETN